MRRAKFNRIVLQKLGRSRVVRLHRLELADRSDSAATWGREHMTANLMSQTAPVEPAG